MAAAAAMAAVNTGGGPHTAPTKLASHHNNLTLPDFPGGCYLPLDLHARTTMLEPNCSTRRLLGRLELRPLHRSAVRGRRHRHHVCRFQDGVRDW
jgi:hypothetical protein